MTQPLKLRASDREDIQVLAACLQDAIVPVTEMCFVPEERRFVMVANRFKWENTGTGTGTGTGRGVAADGPAADVEDAPYLRTNCGVTIDGVDSVRRRNLDLQKRSQMLSLLTIQTEDDGLLLVFAGDACVHLKATDWTCRLCDLGEPWPSRLRPTHALDDGPQVRHAP